MDHKYKALLQNIPTRHVITSIAKPADRPQQIAKLRNLDINNFFILGSLQSIRDVLGKKNKIVSNYMYFPYEIFNSPQIRQETSISHAILPGMLLLSLVVKFLAIAKMQRLSS